jgi:hypothetical protein
MWIPRPCPCPYLGPRRGTRNRPRRNARPWRRGRAISRPRARRPAAYPGSASLRRLPTPPPHHARGKRRSACPPPQTAPAAAPSAKDILDRAKRDIGGIDKALRKENKPYIAAPLDSPQIRMRRGMEQAAAMAPNRLWEAPKVEALVNDTGDGARRSRVITGNGTYCITDRAPTTSIDMIEKHGKQRITSCPQHELPASQQEWRTLRD